VEKEPEVIEVDVERLDPEEDPGPGSDHWGRAVGPVLAGVIIDVLDLATIGAMGLYLGFLLGAPAGWYLARHLGLDRRRAFGAALGCGLYCTIPFTSPIPVATMIGIWARARQAV
jgi:hypothetical protein